LRCGRPGHNCGRSSFFVGNLCRWSMPSGAAFTRMHSAQIGRRYCVTAPASWPSSRRALQLLLHAATHTSRPWARTSVVVGRSPRARAPGDASMRGRVSAAYGAYAVRCPHHTTALSHRPDRRWPLIASHRRQNKSMQAAAMLPQSTALWPLANAQRHRHVGLSVSLHCRLLP